MRSNDTFENYLMTILVQQLEHLSNPKADIYDIESYDQKSLVKYLTYIWK